jgi:hypothetical protein
MKKKTVKRASRKSAKRVVRHVSKSSSMNWMWDKDHSMTIMLAAGTIILVVVGMFMAGWL